MFGVSGGTQLQFLLAGVSLSVSFRAIAETRVISNASYPFEIGAPTNPLRDGAAIAVALEAIESEKRSIAVLKDADQRQLARRRVRIRSRSSPTLAAAQPIVPSGARTSRY